MNKQLYLLLAFVGIIGWKVFGPDQFEQKFIVDGETYELYQKGKSGAGTLTYVYASIDKTKVINLYVINKETQAELSQYRSVIAKMFGINDSVTAESWENGTATGMVKGVKTRGISFEGLEYKFIVVHTNRTLRDPEQAVASDIDREFEDERMSLEMNSFKIDVLAYAE